MAHIQNTSKLSENDSISFFKSLACIIVIHIQKDYIGIGELAVTDNSTDLTSYVSPVTGYGATEGGYTGFFIAITR